MVVVALPQFGIAAAILLMELSGPEGECYINSEWSQQLCPAINDLALMTIFSSLLLSVLQVCALCACRQRHVHLNPPCCTWA